MSRYKEFDSDVRNTVLNEIRGKIVTIEKRVKEKKMSRDKNIEFEVSGNSIKSCCLGRISRGIRKKKKTSDSYSSDNFSTSGFVQKTNTLASVNGGKNNNYSSEADAML